MHRTSFEDMNCSIARSLEVIGEWWTPLILRDAFFGVTRFDEFQQRLGIARNILAARLDTLVDHGVLERRPYDEARGRYDYVLTDKGKALWPVLVALRQWGDEWVVGDRQGSRRHGAHDVWRAARLASSRVTTAASGCDAGTCAVVPGPGLDDPTMLRSVAPG